MQKKANAKMQFSKGRQQKNNKIKKNKKKKGFEEGLWGEEEKTSEIVGKSPFLALSNNKKKQNN